MKPKTRVQWTTEEIEILTKLWTQGYSPRQMRPFLPNHSEEGIKQRRIKLELPPRFNRRQWTIGQRNIVHDAIDRVILDLAQRMNRTPSAVRNVAGEAVMSFCRRQKSKGKIAA